MSDEAAVWMKLNDGRNVEVKICTCGECLNEFYVPALSEEWRPNYCPFCGIKFVKTQLVEVSP